MDEDTIDCSLGNKNPWTDDDRYFGPVKNCLLLAEKTGHRRQTCSPRREEIVAEAKKKYSSLKLLGILREIENTKAEINKVNFSIQKRLQDKETKDITHLDVLEKRVHEINDLSSHLQTIVSKKDQLISRLQQPYVGDFLKIQAAHKRYASELFLQIVPVLSDLSKHLDNIEWSSKVDFCDGQLDSVLTDMSSSIATLHSNVQSLYQMESTVRQLHQQRT